MKNNMVLSILSSVIMLVGIQNAVIAQEAALSCPIDAGAMLGTVRMFTKEGSSAHQLSVPNLLNKLAVHSAVICEGTDEALRPTFVNVQAGFERALVHWLKNKQIEECTCIIHTPAPATPLCTNGEISVGLVDSAISRDPQRLLTVQKRPNIIRAYLHEGGRLIAVYPQKGRTLRSAEQLAVFDDLLQQNPRLEAFALDCDQIPQDLIGATYLIRISDSKKYVLSIRSYQANSPADDKWAIWFGSLQDPVIMERVERVLSFLKRHGLPFQTNTSVTGFYADDSGRHGASP